MKSKLLVFVMLAALSSGAVSRPAARRDPPYVRFQLAGGDVRDDRGEGANRHDVKAGYFLIYTGDCDGASLDLILMPDRFPPGVPAAEHDDWNFLEMGHNSPKRVLPNLRTGTGVNVGDSPDTVRRKLRAAPQNIADDGDLRTWSYYAVVTIGSGKERGARNYTAQYAFYRNKLWGIRYNLQTEEGC